MPPILRCNTEENLAKFYKVPGKCLEDHKLNIFWKRTGIFKQEMETEQNIAKYKAFERADFF